VQKKQKPCEVVPLLSGFGKGGRGQRLYCAKNQNVRKGKNGGGAVPIPPGLFGEIRERRGRGGDAPYAGRKIPICKGKRGHVKFLNKKMGEECRGILCVKRKGVNGDR